MIPNDGVVSIDFELFEEQPLDFVANAAVFHTPVEMQLLSTIRAQYFKFGRLLAGLLRDGQPTMRGTRPVFEALKTMVWAIRTLHMHRYEIVGKSDENRDALENSVGLIEACLDDCFRDLGTLALVWERVSNQYDRQAIEYRTHDRKALKPTFGAAKDSDRLLQKVEMLEAAADKRRARDNCRMSSWHKSLLQREGGQRNAKIDFAVGRNIVKYTMVTRTNP